MANSGQNAVYNSRIPDMPIPPSRILRTSCQFLVFLLLGGLAWGGTWDFPVEQLSAKIIAVTGPGAASVDVTNRSSLSKAEVETIRRLLLDRLSSSGLRFVSAEQAAVTVQVSLSENVQDYIWVAEIRQSANESSVVMVSTPHPNAVAMSRETSTLSIRKSLIWTSDEQILDAAIINGMYPRMVVLYPTQIKLYKLQGDHWQEDQAFPLTHVQPWPRDLRGRVVLRKDHLFDAYLPGILCQSTSSSLSCRESDDPWPVGTAQISLNAFFAPSRNFFTGAISPAIGKKTTAPAFYSAAPIPRDKYTLWILAGVDGRVHMLDGVSDLTAGKLDWGSDIASVHSTCGSGWQVMTTGSGTGQDDTVQAFELPDREPIAVGPAVEFSGGVTSLWAAPEENAAMAITRNAETGKHEAYLLTINCGQ